MVALLSANGAAGRSGTGSELPRSSPTSARKEKHLGQWDQGEGFVILGLVTTHTSYMSLAH